MPSVLDHLRIQLTNNYYSFSHVTDNDALFTAPDGQRAWVSYVDKEITPDNIRRALEFSGHVLFIVDEKLIPDEIESRKATPYWLRVLHGLYMGRIYVWNGRYLFALHFDYDSGDVNESGIIQPDALLFVETGTWLKGWSGIYRLARFYDRAFWSEDAGNYSRSSYDQARDYYQRRDDASKHGGYYSGQGNTYDDPRANQPPPKQETPKRDWLKEFLNCGSLAAAKQHYRKLALEFHPDRSGSETTADMQLINAAWDKAQRLMV